MILSPREAVNNNWIMFPKETSLKQDDTYITQTIDPEKYIQQNGIDVPVSRMFWLDEFSAGLLSDEKRIYKSTEEIFPKHTLKTRDTSCKNCYKVDSQHVYDWCSDFELMLPDDVCALVIVRSSLNRIGGTINTGNYDSGFQGLIGGTLTSRAGTIFIQQYSRIAQVMFYKTSSDKLYTGIYQNTSQTYWLEGVNSVQN
ncbi:MAG: hypothetical protein KDH96_06225 [Candidatus Riesia sp.]|nr:hypothetical protein [Candidatus Riesia sp.]